MSNSKRFISLNGSVIPEGRAGVFPGQAGLYYGAGCFETFMADQGYIFRFEDHLNRLYSGLTYLGVAKSLYPSKRSILKQIEALLHENGLSGKKARVRIQISLDERNGYSMDENLNLIQLIEAHEVPEPSRKTAALITAATRVVPSSCRPAVYKLSNMLHYRAAFREALRRDADDALMLTVDNHIAETTVANIFWKKGEVVYTPSVNCDLLPGIMRDTVVKILREAVSLEIREGTYSLPDILQADLVWLTNSIVNIRPVHRVDQTVYVTSDGFYELLTQQLHHVQKPA